MATIKDALDIIGKLTTKDREILRTILLSTVSVKSADMESFLTDERFSNYNIQHINSYHSELKRFLYQFKGASTKYLNNYLVWNNLINYAKETDAEKKNIFTTFVLTTSKTIRNKDIPNREPVPLVAYKNCVKISHIDRHSQ